MHVAHGLTFLYSEHTFFFPVLLVAAPCFELRVEGTVLSIIVRFDQTAPMVNTLRTYQFAAK